MSDERKILIVGAVNSAALVSALINKLESERDIECNNNVISIHPYHTDVSWAYPFKQEKIVRPFQDLHSRPYGKQFRRLPFK